MVKLFVDKWYYEQIINKVVDDFRVIVKEGGIKFT